MYVAEKVCLFWIGKKTKLDIWKFGLRLIFDFSTPLLRFINEIQEKITFILLNDLSWVLSIKQVNKWDNDY